MLLHVDQARVIVEALERIPARAMVPVEDLRVAEEELVKAGRHLSPGDLRKLGSQVRDRLDTDGSEPAEDKARQREALKMTHAEGGVKFNGFLAAENAELFTGAILGGSKPHKTVDGEPDPRPRDKRQADALTALLHSAAATGDLPANGGVKPHITVTIGLDDLISAGKHATGDLTYGTGLSASAVRMLACDAGIIPMVLGSDSQPLDVGREERFVTGPIRTALVHRDKGCVVCGAPPIFCDAHHLIHWIDGGPTCLSNLVLLCRVHHIAVHQNHWKITITDNLVNVTRPHWTEPSRHTFLSLARSRPPSSPGTTPTDTAPAPGPAGRHRLVGTHRPARAWPLTGDAPHPAPADPTRANPWDDEPPVPAPRGAAPNSPWSDETPLSPKGQMARLNRRDEETPVPPPPDTEPFNPRADETAIPAAGEMARLNPWGEQSPVSPPVDAQPFNPWGDETALDSAGGVARLNARGEVTSVPPPGDVEPFNPWGEETAHVSAGGVARLNAPGEVTSVPPPGDVEPFNPWGDETAVPPAGEVARLHPWDDADIASTG
ncbi:DUF222 domain-containing protein [Kribbella sp. NPDC006257]|uniref:HNH endonuclease signature motif containing protein n=1 Tax=Kribbella sp. NPDC006257 TaxID=3156738 RepID=UPI0033BA95F5